VHLGTYVYVGLGIDMYICVNVHRRVYTHGCMYMCYMCLCTCKCLCRHICEIETIRTVWLVIAKLRDSFGPKMTFMKDRSWMVTCVYTYSCM
jgi:hypothetical protein